jgi:hypothetical protein
VNGADPESSSGARRERLARLIADGDALDPSIARGAPADRELDGADVEVFRVLSAMRGFATVDATGVALRARQQPIEHGYEILHELGRGSYGVVYLARDRALDREVALKVVREDRFPGGEARERFLREARTLAKLEHPNVVRIHSVDEADGRLRLSLERVEGKTFEQYVKDHGPMPPQAVARIGAELCSALEAIHAAGLVHGDLKPSNVMRARDGRTVLLDFGIARDPTTDATPDGLHVPQGTPLYMAPEVFDRKLPDGRSDLFALGATLFYLATGSLPFPGGDARTIRAMQGNRAALEERLRELPRALREFVLDCLAEDRDRRPSDAATAKRRLRDHLRAGVRRRIVLGGISMAALLAIVAMLALRSARRGVLDADFLRLDASSEQRLRDGDRVRDGDRLVFEIEVDRPMRVYAFNEDDRGAVTSLHPLPGATPGRMLAPGRYRLPGTIAGQPQEWILGTGGRAEFFVVVASREPIAAAEALDRELGTRAPRRAVSWRRATCAASATCEPPRRRNAATSRRSPAPASPS